MVENSKKNNLIDEIKPGLNNLILIGPEGDFSKSEIAEVTKLFGVLALGVGLFVGGIMIQKFGLLASLIITGVLQAVSNLAFAYQAASGNDLEVLIFTIAIENVTGGMGTAAFVAYLSSLTNTAFTATQYALLASIGTFGRTTLAASSGALVDQLNGNWGVFFIITALMVTPSLIIFYFIKNKMNLKVQLEVQHHWYGHIPLKMALLLLLDSHLSLYLHP